MKKITKIASAIAAFAVAGVMAVSCGTAATVGTVLKVFGEFTYGAHALTEFATTVIDAATAKNIVKDNQQALVENGVNPSADETDDQPDNNTEKPSPVDPDDITNIKPSAEMIQILSRNFSGVTVSTKYYEDGKDVQQVKVDELIGSNFTTTLKNNSFTPFSSLVARHLYLYEELITFMEEENARFKALENYNSYPFKTVFSYHSDSDGNLVIQSRDFVEIASNVGGGIGCSYRQDTEMQYDKQNKISKWHTSLGVISSTPNGTVRQGYILEMEFDWKEKD